MNSEIERWIATWLDSASERGYQNAFVTTLLLDGHEILISTSHNSMELGKDVVTRTPDGKVHAFQLKGNPSARYSMHDYQSGLGQILQLVNTPVSPALTGKSSIDHIPTIVTNGQVTEDVQAAINLFNQIPDTEKLNKNNLSVISRGTILSRMYLHARGIWPTNISGELAILKFLSMSGDAELDVDLLGDLVRSVLRWEEEASERAAGERIAGTCLITNIILSRWSESGNIFEMSKGLVILLIHLYCYLDGHRTRSKIVDRVLSDLRRTLFAKIDIFTTFISERSQSLVKKNIYAECPFCHSRKMQIYGLIAGGMIEKSRLGRAVRDMDAADIFRKKVDFRPYVWPDGWGYDASFSVDGYLERKFKRKSAG
jgi:hypothetical protein